MRCPIHGCKARRGSVLGTLLVSLCLREGRGNVHPALGGFRARLGWGAGMGRCHHGSKADEDEVGEVVDEFCDDEADSAVAASSEDGVMEGRDEVDGEGASCTGGSCSIMSCATQYSLFMMPRYLYPFRALIKSFIWLCSQM